MLSHPEGGYYCETYRSPHNVTIQVSIPPGTETNESTTASTQTKTITRSASTGILFLLTADSPISHLHKIAFDEMWHFYGGDPLTVVVLGTDGQGGTKQIVLGESVHHEKQAVVEGGRWFGSFTNGGVNGYSLVGCTVAPGFEFEDFVIGVREELENLFPSEARLVERLAIHKNSIHVGTV
ncbi:hypothetical protein HK100_003943 [Physocladia obscura]|uniref:DUF985 domain-containing protein n=1 Tax=Physocladia obscura TaxID=109957 RepID=A0AAD5STM7_9FUNG|nr:hypothetical protein HK100_003943 [Physocladia obscura]